MHEQSETVERDGRWVNVYGSATPRAGQVLPGEPTYDSLDAAVAAARRRSERHGLAETASAVEGEFTGEATPAPAPVQPSSLYGNALAWLRPVDTSRSDAALGERMRVGREYRDQIASSVERQRADTESLDRTASQQAAEREAARPGQLALPNAPSMQARAFADPGPNASVLQQLQSVMLGAGLMAQQIGGLKGSAAAAVSALRGAFQGWAEGDRERANRALTEWEAQSKKLLQEHRARVEAYRDIVEDQKTSWAEKMAVLSMRSKADEWASMGKASEASDWDQVIKAYTHAETLGSQQQMQMVRTVIDLEKWKADSAEKMREFALKLEEVKAGREQRAADAAARLEEQKESREQRASDAAARLAEQKEAREQRAADARDARADRMAIAREGLEIRRDTLDLRKQMASGKEEDKKRGFETMGRVLGDMDTLADRLAASGKLPTSDTAGAKIKARIARELHPNDPAWREWLALQGAMVGFERQIYDDKGARALSVYKSLLDFVDNPPPIETAKAVIGRMRGYLDAGKPGGSEGATIRVKRKSDGATGTLDPKDFDPSKYERVGG